MRKLIIMCAIFLCTQSVLLSQNNQDAYKMMRYQRYQSAIDIYKGQIQHNPIDTSANYWLGIAYLKKELVNNALTHFKNMVVASPNVLYKAGLAQALAANKQKVEAQNILAMLLTPSKVTSQLVAIAIGNAFAQNANFATAKSYYLQATKLQPANCNNYLLLGNNALKMGNDTSANTYFTKALSLDTNYAPTHFAFAKMYINQKKAALYVPYLKKTLALDAMYTPAWYEMYRYAYYNDKQNVKKYYAKYLDLSDKTEQQEYQLLVLDYNAKKYQSVINRANEILKNDESNVPVDLYKYVGFSYYKLNNIIDAYSNMIEYMEVQDSTKITSFDTYLTAQFAVRLQYKDAAAVKAIITAFNTDTSKINKKYYAGAMVNYYITANDTYNTTIWREKLLPYKGINKADMYKIGYAWFQLDSLHRADSLFAQFVSLYPNAYKGIYMQASIQAKLDTSMATNNAANYFEDFIKKVGSTNTANYKPMLQHAYNYLGGFYLYKKNYGKALENYLKLLQLQPNNQPLKKTVADLKKYHQLKQ